MHKPVETAGSGKPILADALRVRAFGRDLIRAKGIMASGACEPQGRPNTWPHQPADCISLKKPLANGEPSTHGQERKLSRCPEADLRLISALSKTPHLPATHKEYRELGHPVAGRTELGSLVLRAGKLPPFFGIMLRQTPRRLALQRAADCAAALDAEVMM
jgi:hypothetical protein